MRTGIEKLDVEQYRHNLDKLIVDGEDSVKRALTYLTSSSARNFYARVLSTLDRYSVPGFGTMGVTVKNGRYVMLYDPFFAARVSFEELSATCEHEVLHIILEHIPRSLRHSAVFTKEEEKTLFLTTRNLAVDAAANALLARNWPKMRDKTLPIGYWVLPEGFTPALPADMSYEVYHELLIETLKSKSQDSCEKLQQLADDILQQQNDAVKQALSNDPANQGDGQDQGQNQSQGQGQGQGQGQPKPSEDLQKQVDDLDPLEQQLLQMLLSSAASHAGWDQASLENAEAESHQLAEHGKELIKAAYDSHAKSRGTLPSFIEQLIREMLQPPVVPWTQFLHNIVQRTRQTKKERGMSRPSKILSAMHFYAKLLAEKEPENELSDVIASRVQLISRTPVFPGIKHSNKFTIIYVIDTSGSMSIRDMQMGLSELQHIQKSDSDVSICVMYVDAHVSKEYWITPSSEIDPRLTGRGGTSFDPAFKRVAELLKSGSDKQPDILVYATDGCAPPPSIKLPIPTVWLITPTGEPCCEEAGHITIQMRDYQLGESAL